jgi:uncharacterized protein DUF5678
MGDRPIRIDNTEVVWIQKNQDYLWEHHAGQWIAVAGEQLVAFGDDRAAVSEEARLKGYPKAVVTGVRRREYQRVRMIL